MLLVQLNRSNRGKHEFLAASVQLDSKILSKIYNSRRVLRMITCFPQGKRSELSHHIPSRGFGGVPSPHRPPSKSFGLIPFQDITYIYMLLVKKSSDQQIWNVLSREGGFMINIRGDLAESLSLSA